MSTLNDKKTNVSKLKIFLIFLAFAIPYGLPNYTQYQLSPLGAQIIEQFALTPVQFNSLFTAPMLPAIFTSIIAGLLVDRYGFKPVITVSIICTVLGAWIRLFAGNYPMMFVGMTLVGTSAGVMSSNASKTLAQLFGPEKVGVVMGLALSISTLGLVVCMSTTTMFPSIFTAFLVAAVLCTVGLILWFVIIPNLKPGTSLQPAKAGEPAPPVDDEPVSVGKAIMVAIKNKYVWLSAISLFCVCGAMTGTGSYIPTALQEVRGFTPEAAGLASSLMMVGNLLGSLITPTLTLKTGKFRLILSLCGVLSAVGCAFAWLAPQGILLYVALMLTGYAFGSGMSQIIAATIRLPGIGPKYAGTAGGVIATLQLLGGVCIPTYYASAIAGTNFHLYFILIGASSLLWAAAMALQHKCLDVKG